MLGIMEGCVWGVFGGTLGVCRITGRVMGRWEGGTLMSKGHKKGKGTGTWDGWCGARQGRGSRES